MVGEHKLAENFWIDLGVMLGIMWVLLVLFWWAYPINYLMYVIDGWIIVDFVDFHQLLSDHPPEGLE